MRITSVTAYPITLTLDPPVKMSHITIAQSHNVLVKVETDEGIVGWGEGVTAARLTGETQSRIEASMDYVAGLVVGEDALARTPLWNKMTGALYGNETAIGALDIALHDIAGKAYGVPANQLIGGAFRDAIPVIAFIGSGDPAADAADTKEKYAAGYRWFKVKLGLADPATELDTIAAVCEAVGPGAVIGADANEAWTEGEAVRFMSELGGLPIRFFEQPIRQGDPAGLARIADRVPVPVCADQSVHSLADIRYFATTSVGGISLKLVKLGGITGVMRGAHLCEQTHMQINLAGKVAETSIAAAANLHAAAAMQKIDWGVSPGNQGIVADVTEPMELVDGALAVPQRPGLGVDVDEDRLEALRSG